MTKINQHIQHEKFLELMNEGVIIEDEDRKILYVNSTFCKMMNIKSENVLGKQSDVFWDGESAKKIQEVNETERKKGVSSNYECVLVNSEGKKIPVLVSGAPLPNGGSMGIVTDLTQVKESESQAALLGHAVEKGSEAFILFDESGKITLWNTGASKIFGYTKSQAKGMNVNDLFTEKFDIESMNTSKELIAKDKQGENVYIAATLSSISHKDKEKYLLIGRDIRSYKELQQSLKDRYEKIQSAYNEFGIMRRKMDYMFELMEMVQRASSIEELGNFIVASLAMLTKIDACALRIRHKGKLKMIAGYGLHKDWQGKKTIPLKGGIIEEAFLNGPQRYFDSQLCEKHMSRRLLQKSGFTSFMAFGLGFQDKLIGGLALYIKSKDKWSVFEDGFLRRYAQAIEIALAIFLLQQDKDTELTLK